MTFPRSCIYGLTDPRTGEVRYIGKTERGIRRVREHFIYLAKDCTYKGNWLRLLAAAGVRATAVVLEEVEPAHLNNAERSWIAYGKEQGWSLTNLTDGGDGVSGRQLSEEHRAKIAEAHRGRRLTEAHRASISKANTGRRLTELSREKIAAARHGRSLRPEALAALLASRGRRKAIVDTLAGVEYSSIVDASKVLGINASCIYNQLAGRSCTAGGRTFSYVVQA